MLKSKRMLSAIQPTGTFTLGNYIGAVKNWHRSQTSFDCIFFIANLHSLTVRQDPEKFKQKTLNCVALLLACGIDYFKSMVFVQSQVKQHTEFAWILQCNTQFGELNRMTQFKDKSLKNSENINAGLFCYPTLMAADILLYEPDYIPIGVDQKQHLELTKVIAARFNRIYGETFKIPKAYINKTGSRIKSLANPTAKMSKSDGNSYGTIFILDEREVVLEKLKKAVTDSDSKIKFDPENKPGISNLLEIYSSLAECSIEETESLFKNTNYGTFKKEVAKTVSDTLEPIQNVYKELVLNQNRIEQICFDGAIKAERIAKNKMDEINKKVGLI